MTNTNTDTDTNADSEQQIDVDGATQISGIEERQASAMNEASVATYAVSLLDLGHSKHRISQPDTRNAQEDSPVILSGFGRKWSIPAALHSPSLSCVTFAVRAMIGR